MHTIMKILHHILLHVKDFFDILYLILPWYHFTVSCAKLFFYCFRWMVPYQVQKLKRMELKAKSMFYVNNGSLQSRCNFCKRVLSYFITNIMATIFDFNGSGRLGREINLYQGGSRWSKIRRGVGVGGGIRTDHESSLIWSVIWYSQMIDTH